MHASHSKTFRHENISVFSARETDIGHFNFHSFSQSRSPNAFIAYFTVQRVSQKFTFTLRKIEIYRVAKQIMNEITNLVRFEKLTYFFEVFCTVGKVFDFFCFENSWEQKAKLLILYHWNQSNQMLFSLNCYQSMKITTLFQL